MTTTRQHPAATPSDYVAAEIRAWQGRLDLTQGQLAARMGKGQTCRRRQWGGVTRGPLVSAVMTALLGGGFVAVLFLGQPPSIDTLFGTCPSISADPLSVCYQPPPVTPAAPVVTVLALEAGHDCSPTGAPGQIPASVVLETGGRIVRLPFAEAWKIVHGPALTHVYGICAK